MAKVSNEKKNLNRLAGEFLVASRLTQRGFMVTLQWGTAIGYDILAFDKNGTVAFIEVKSSASYERSWILQKKYAHPKDDAISVKRRFVCCVDLTVSDVAANVYVFPADIVAKGLHYFYNDRFSKSDSYTLRLDKRPIGKTKDLSIQTVGDHIDAQRYLEAYTALGLEPVAR